MDWNSFNDSCAAHNLWNGDMAQFVEVEIKYGRFLTIRLFEEGMLCSGINAKWHSKTKFFPLKKLDSHIILMVEGILIYDPFFSKDTLVDDPNILIYDDHDIDCVVIKDNNWNRLIWVDGKCEKFKQLLIMLNNLIPARNREFFSMRSMYGKG